MNITIDCLVLRETYQEYLESEKAAPTNSVSASFMPITPYLMIQGAQLTNGIFRELTGKWCSPGGVGQSLLIYELL